MTHLLHPADETGCGYFRVINPAATLNHLAGGQFVKAFHYLPSEELVEREITTVVTQRQLTKAQIREMRRYKKGGIFLINDLDDLLWNVPKSNSFSRTFTTENRKSLLEGIGIADLNTASTVPLQEYLKRWAGVDSVIVPNTLLPQYYAPSPRIRTTDKLQVMWAGSSTHGGDLKKLRRIIEKTKDVAEFTLFGYCPTQLRPHVNFIEGVPFNEYHAALLATHFDLALAPLEMHPFNECKSNLKLLEFGACGVPVVTSDIYPYKDNPATKITYTNEVDQWIDAIIHYATDDSARLADAEKCLIYANSFSSVSVDHIEHLKHTWRLQDVRTEIQP